MPVNQSLSSGIKSVREQAKGCALARSCGANAAKEGRFSCFHQEGTFSPTNSSYRSVSFSERRRIWWSLCKVWNRRTRAVVPVDLGKSNMAASLPAFLVDEI
jgi:hypothetical protein